MPRIPIDYSKTQIYKLKHKDDHNDENIYIGNTTEWTKRKYYHNCSCNKESYGRFHQKKYVFIRENGGWEEWDMKWIEDYPCNNKREAEAREEYWRKEFNAKLNMRRPFITADERKPSREIANERARRSYKNWVELLKNIPV